MAFFPFAPQFLSLAGGTITGALTVSGTTTLAGNLLSNSVPWIPSDNGLLAATDDLTYNATGAMVAGTVYLRKLFVNTGFTVTNILAHVSVAGSGASTGTFVGLYSSAGSLLSGSADQATPLSSLGLATMPLSTPQALSAGTFAWIAILVNFATTQPTLRASSGTALVQNTNLAAASLDAAVNGTGVLVLPSPSITPASNTAAGAFPFWFGVS